MAYVSVDVDVELCDFDTEDLVSELKRRGKYDDASGCSVMDTTDELIEKIWMRRRLGQDYDALVEELIRSTLGKVI